MASIRYIALLRAINVGTGRKVPMADLRELLQDAGASGVQTYIQSGNVVFDHTTVVDAGALGDDLQQRLAAAFGFDIPVILRRADEWAAIVSDNPFAGADPTKLLVSFLRDDPAAGATDAVDPSAFAPEQFVLAGREIYLHLPGGFGRAILPKALSRALQVPETTRNWRTVLALGDIAL